MLRSEHVMARLYRGRLVPHRLSPDDRRVLDVAAELCDLYAANVGLTEGRAWSGSWRLGRRISVPASTPAGGSGSYAPSPSSWRSGPGGAAPTAADPYTLRTRVFELAAALPEPPAEEAGSARGPDARGRALSGRRGDRGRGPGRLDVRRQAGGPAPRRVRPALTRRARSPLQRRPGTGRTLLGEGPHRRPRARGRRQARLPLRQASGSDLRPRTARPRLPAPPRRPALHLRRAPASTGCAWRKFLPGLLLTSPWSSRPTSSGRAGKRSWSSTRRRRVWRATTWGRTPSARPTTSARRSSAPGSARRTRATGSSNGEPTCSPSRRGRRRSSRTLRCDTPGPARPSQLEILGFWSERNLVERVALLREAERQGHRVLVAASERLGASQEALSGAVKGASCPSRTGSRRRPCSRRCG